MVERILLRPGPSPPDCVEQTLFPTGSRTAEGGSPGGTLECNHVASSWRDWMRTSPPRWTAPATHVLPTRLPVIAPQCQVKYVIPFSLRNLGCWGGGALRPTWIGEGIAVGVVEGCEKIRPRIAGFPAILHDFATGHTRCGHFKVQPSGKVVQKLRFLRVYSQIFEDYAVYRRAGLRRQFRGLCRLSRIMSFIVELA